MRSTNLVLTVAVALGNHQAAIMQSCTKGFAKTTAQHGHSKQMMVNPAKTATQHAKLALALTKTTAKVVERQNICQTANSAATPVSSEPPVALKTDAKAIRAAKIAKRAPLQQRAPNAKAHSFFSKTGAVPRRAATATLSTKQTPMLPNAANVTLPALPAMAAATKIAQAALTRRTSFTPANVQLSAHLILPRTTPCALNRLRPSTSQNRFAIQCCALNRIAAMASATSTATMSSAPTIVAIAASTLMLRTATRTYLAPAAKAHLVVAGARRAKCARTTRTATNTLLLKWTRALVCR